MNKCLQREGSRENLNSRFGKRDLEVLLELHQSMPPSLPLKWDRSPTGLLVSSALSLKSVSTSCRFYQLTMLCMYPFCASSLPCSRAFFVCSWNVQVGLQGAFSLLTYPSSITSTSITSKSRMQACSLCP